MDDAGERGNDPAEKIAQFATSDQDVVDIEQNLQAVSLLGEFLLGGLCGLKVQRIVHGDGYLRRDALHELNVRIGNGLWTNPSKTHGAKTVLRGGQWKNGKRANSSAAQPDEKFRKARFCFKIGNDKRLLRLPDPTRRIAFHGIFRADRLIAFHASFQDVKAHGVLDGIVENQSQEIGFDYGVQARGEFVE